MITAEFTIPGMHCRDHEVSVPLDWNDETGEHITVFAREIVDPLKKNDDLPLLVYLQGGPGGKGPRPLDLSGWVGGALRHYRIISLDQRGTGRSSAVSSATMQRFETDAEAGEFLLNFRADSIIKDAEYLRKNVFGGKRWSTLGQSYGGFLTLTYLSHAPEALVACYVTGGLASIWPSAKTVYERTYPRVLAKNAEFYARYPHHVDTVAKIADRLAEGDVRLPDGSGLSVERFQHLGLDFGMKPGYERMHYLIDEAWDHYRPGELSDTFLQQVYTRTNYLTDPLFATLQESIYGHLDNGPIGWAAQAERDLRPEFETTARPMQFTGEMVYPWMFEQIKGLQAFRGAVHYLAERPEWSPLYDLDRLAANEVPLVAAVYYDDMYVDAYLQLDTARGVGGARTWVTNEYEHDGIGSDRVFNYLHNMVAELGGGKH